MAQAMTPQRRLELREVVRNMFIHAFDSYMNHAFPFDEVRPISCQPRGGPPGERSEDNSDFHGGYGLTLIECLDTLLIMGNVTEFKRAVQTIEKRENFDINVTVNVFEMNIRVVGGLLSAHLLITHPIIYPIYFPEYDGFLLRLAHDLASRLLPVFNTKTGIPAGTVSLQKPTFS